MLSRARAPPSRWFRDRSRRMPAPARKAEPRAIAMRRMAGFRAPLQRAISVHRSWSPPFGFDAVSFREADTLVFILRSYFTQVLKTNLDQSAATAITAGPARHDAASDGGCTSLRRDILPERNANHFMGLQGRQHLAREAPDLLHEHFMRQRATVEADLNLVRAGGLRRADDPFRD